MLSLRFSFASVVACFLLLAGPAQAATTQPVGLKTGRPATAARRGTTGRPGAAAKAATLAGSKEAARTSAAATLPQPAAQPAAAVAPKLIYVAGIVFNKEGRPCPGVCVFPTTDTHQIVVTDAQGAFQLQVPAQTNLSIQADYFGLGSNRVAINSYMTQPVHIVLGR